MKYIKTITRLYRRALEKAAYSLEGYGYAKLTRQGTPVYEVIVDWGKNEAILKHYGTTTLIYKLDLCAIVYWYGEGVSDRDSMNTFLHCVGERNARFRYGPKMGFCLDNGEELIPLEYTLSL